MNLAFQFGSWHSRAARLYCWHRGWHYPKWAPTYTEKVRGRLAWLYPVVGDKPISDIKAPDPLSAIRPREAAGKAETARRTRSVAGQVIRYAIATCRAENDPTTAMLDEVLGVRVDPDRAPARPCRRAGARPDPLHAFGVRR
jgi:integrase